MKQLTILLFLISTSIFSQTVNFYYDRAQDRMEKHEYDAAIKDLNEVLKKDKHFYEAYHDLGVIYAIKKQKLEAIKYFDKAIKENGKYYSAFVNRANLYYEMGKKKEATSDFASVISEILLSTSSSISTF